MKTVHLILNAHIDPVWLWPWQAGLDSVLATCRSMCDLLDANPDAVMTRGEAWAYEQVERVAPPLFERIRRHVEAGRWAIVGGWYLQPDCNFPSDFAMAKQIDVGREYFQQRFGFVPKVAYNVDSFGHAAGLPKLMRDAGQEYYVMMRPQEHERTLPARLFRWRGHEDGPEVITFRIARSYLLVKPSPEHVWACTKDLPEGIEHTMCFMGMGDHGGGPSQELITWCRQNRDAFAGWRLEFSSPQRFFDAIRDQRDLLPAVVGELQHHATGCYTVHRPIKVSVRKAEHLVRRAELALQQQARPEPQDSAAVREAWRRIAFLEFHDMVGGTSLPSAYEQAEAQAGVARTIADEILQYDLRRRLNDLPDDHFQRAVFFNASDRPYAGYVAFEPWLDWRAWQPHWRLLDEQGRAVPYQTANGEAACFAPIRLFVPLEIQSGHLRVLRIDDTEPASDPGPTPQVSTTAGSSRLQPPPFAAGGLSSRAFAEFETIRNDVGVAVDLAMRRMQLPGGPLPLPRLDLIEDVTDTWSHGIDRYGEGALAGATWDSPVLMDAGPLAATFLQAGRIGESRLLAEYRVYAAEPYVELNLRVHWAERHKVLKLVLLLPAGGQTRSDGVLGGAIDRALDGAERPLRDRTLLGLADGRATGLVAPDVFALDATPQRARLTLLRSPLMAHHDPCRRADLRDRVADQGVHDFRFRFFFATGLSGSHLDDHALMLHRPLLTADLTRGMRRS